MRLQQWLIVDRFKNKQRNHLHPHLYGETIPLQYVNRKKRSPQGHPKIYVYFQTEHNTQWIPGHPKIGNNLTGHAAKEDFGFLYKEKVPTIRNTINVIKASICDSPITHDQNRQIYSDINLKIDKT